MRYEINIPDFIPNVKLFVNQLFTSLKKDNR